MCNIAYPDRNRGSAQVQTETGADSVAAPAAGPGVESRPSQFKRAHQAELVAARARTNEARALAEHFLEFVRGANTSQLDTKLHQLAESMTSRHPNDRQTVVQAVAKLNEHLNPKPKTPTDPPRG